MAALTKKMDQMVLKSENTMAVAHHQEEAPACVFCCQFGHTLHTCQYLVSMREMMGYSTQSQEAVVNAIQKYDPNSPSYNPGWRDKHLSSGLHLHLKGYHRATKVNSNLGGLPTTTTIKGKWFHLDHHQVTLTFPLIGVV